MADELTTPGMPEPGPATEEAKPPVEVTPPPDDEAQWKWLAERDPDELVRKNPRLAGKVGDLADRRYKERLAAERKQWEAEQAEKLREAEAERLMEEDPAAYVDNKKRQAAVKEREKLWEGQLNTDVFHAWYYTLPEAVQKKLAGKNWGGQNTREAWLNFLKEATKVMTEEARPRLSAEERKEIVAALKKDMMTEQIKGEGTPDLTSGHPPVAGRLPTLEEYEKMDPTSKEAKEAEKLIRSRMPPIYVGRE